MLKSLNSAVDGLNHANDFWYCFRKDISGRGDHVHLVEHAEIAGELFTFIKEIK